MGNESFQAAYAAKQEQAEEALRRIMAQYRSEPARLYDAMEYSLFAGGKRFRPVLMLAAHELAPETDHRIYEFAAAIEMIHTYSLIHDDLPAMDDDDLRRGQPTCHKVYGEAMAILAGDGLLNLAYEVMGNAVTKQPDARSANAMGVIAKAAGAAGMVGGQAADMEGIHLPSDGDLLWFIHRRKTGALIRSSLEAGMILGGAQEKEVQSIREYGEALGMVFQIKDDLLDTDGSAAELGKPTGSDVKNDKKTFVTVYGKQRAEELLGEWLENAIESLRPFGDRGAFLQAMVRYAAERNR